MTWLNIGVSLSFETRDSHNVQTVIISTSAEKKNATLLIHNHGCSLRVSLSAQYVLRALDFRGDLAAAFGDANGVRRGLWCGFSTETKNNLTLSFQLHIRNTPYLKIFPIISMYPKTLMVWRLLSLPVCSWSCCFRFGVGVLVALGSVSANPRFPLPEAGALSFFTVEVALAFVALSLALGVPGVPLRRLPATRLSAIEKRLPQWKANTLGFKLKFHTATADFILENNAIVLSHWSL